MLLSAQTIRKLRLLDPMLESYRDVGGNSSGLSACGYDLTASADIDLPPGLFVLASAAERFNLPADIAAIIHDKSSFARRGIAVQNTVAEPGWHGYLTLEITNHGTEHILIRKGCAVCQALFYRLDEPTEQPYSGKYQDQGPGPTKAR
jgi:dCTP deaminase